MLPVALSSSSSCLPHGTTLTKATTKKKILSNCKNFCIADRLEQIVQVEMKPLENILLTMIFLASSVVVACGLRAGNNNKWDEKIEGKVTMRTAVLLAGPFVGGSGCTTWQRVVYSWKDHRCILAVVRCFDGQSSLGVQQGGNTQQL